jgi:hypothetical protein
MPRQPALALSAEDEAAIAEALTRVRAPTDDDRTAGLVALYSVAHVPSVRHRWLVRVALDAIRAKRRYTK